MGTLSIETQLNTSVDLRLARRLAETIQTVELLSLGVEDLYDYFAEAAQANPMIQVQRVPLPELPIYRHEGFDFDELHAHEEDDIRTYLHRQLNFLKLPREQKRIASYLADSLDESGFFKEDCPETARELSVTEAELEDALKIVQSLDPPGIGARTLRECLLLQLERLPRRDFSAEKIVSEHWELLLKKPSSGILSKELRLPLKDVEGALDRISKLNPRPSNGFSHGEIQYTVPDAYLVNDENELKIQLVNSFTLTIDKSYSDLFSESEDAQVKRFLNHCAHQAEKLQSRLSYRNDLLEKILLICVQTQMPYLTASEEKRPLLQKDVANLLDVNASTVSRAVQGKYIYVDNRCLPVHELFSRPSVGNEAHSMHGIQQKISALIREENPGRPLSDQKIHERLRESGVNVSRRLVAKYRALADIPPAYARKIR